MSTRPLPLPLGTILSGKYQIDSVLGVGGMGTVFAAKNIDLDKPVAIKVLHSDLARDPDIVRRLRQEGRAAAAIGHPGIVDVIDLGTTDAGDHFIVMERLEGESLGAAITRQHQLPPPIAVGIVGKAAEALAAAHAKGIIHRDLKPDNIFLVIHPAPIVKLVDFGISKQQQDGLTVTTSGVVMGTPLYMSPEQARGARDVGPASDVYALGAILYQTLAGRPPLTASNYNEMMSKILMEQPVPLAVVRPNLPRSLTDLVQEMLAKNDWMRPAAQDVANRLRTIGRELDTSTIAFSPTLQPDNNPDPAPPEHAETFVPSSFDTPAPAALGATAATLPPGVTAHPATPRPTAPTSAAGPRSRLPYAIGAIVALAAIVAVVIVATRESAPREQPVAGPVDAAAAVATDAAAAVATDAVAAPAVVDAEPVAVDATPIAVDASTRPIPVRDAGTVVRADAAVTKPDAAAGSGLEIDEKFPPGR